MAGDHGDVIEVGRLRLGLPGAKLAGEVMPFWEGDLADLWALRVTAGSVGRTLVVQTDATGVVAHAGLPRAAARLRALGLLGQHAEILDDTLRPVLDAIGGLTPGYPAYADESVEVDASGGASLVLTAPGAWVRFAAAGGVGVVPADHYGGSGARAPVPTGRMVCDIQDDYTLEWTYELDGERLATFAGKADDGEPMPDELTGLAAERVIASARRTAAAPLAVPASPVRRHGDGWTVDFLGIGVVAVGG